MLHKIDPGTRRLRAPIKRPDLRLVLQAMATRLPTDLPAHQMSLATMNDQDTPLLLAVKPRGVRTDQVIHHHPIHLQVLEIQEAVTDLLVVVLQADHDPVEVVPDQATAVGPPLQEVKDNRAFLPSLSYSCRPTSCGLQPHKRSTYEK